MDSWMLARCQARITEKGSKGGLTMNHNTKQGQIQTYLNYARRRRKHRGKISEKNQASLRSLINFHIFVKNILILRRYLSHLHRNILH